MHFKLSSLIVWIAFWIVHTYSKFQVNIFSNKRKITKCQRFCTMTTATLRPQQYLGVFSVNSRAKNERLFKPLPNKPCCTRLLKTLREKEKLLIMSNFFFSHSVFYPFYRTFCHFHQI